MEKNHPLWAQCCFMVQDILQVSFSKPHGRGTPNPGQGLKDELTEEERTAVARLMRINHVGEVCAQALYLAKHRQTTSPKLKHNYWTAAQEERDHLIWTADVLESLHAHPSYLNPLWYGGAYALGTIAAGFGDVWGLGFMAETERQVAEHLKTHLEKLPAGAHQSRAVLNQMTADEEAHASAAETSGGAPLPWPVPGLMRLAATVMKVVAARI